MHKHLTITMDMHGTVTAVRYSGRPLRVTPWRLAILWKALQSCRIRPDSRFVRAGGRLVGREDVYNVEGWVR